VVHHPAASLDGNPPNGEHASICELRTDLGQLGLPQRRPADCPSGAWQFYRTAEEAVTSTHLNLPPSVIAALDAEMQRTGRTCSEIVSAALSKRLDLSLHSLFQVSTAQSSMVGIDDGTVTVERLLDHGDLGIGTAAELDDALVIVDGTAYRVEQSGTVREADPAARVHYAVVTRFLPEIDVMAPGVRDISDLLACCDAIRGSTAAFFALRIDGHFDHLEVRAGHSKASGVPPRDAASQTFESRHVVRSYRYKNVGGIVAGFWSPELTASLDHPGYHFHFLSADRGCGGHLIDCAAGPLRLRLEAIDDPHLALPRTPTPHPAEVGTTYPGGPVGKAPVH
jgi:acetolactate decarboxylase